MSQFDDPGRNPSRSLPFLSSPQRRCRHPTPLLRSRSDAPSSSPPSTAQGMQTPQRGRHRPSLRKGGGLLCAGDTGCACRPGTTPMTTTSATSSTRPPTRSFVACGRPTTGGLLSSPLRGPPPQHLHPPPFPQIHIRSSPVVTFDLICSTFNKSCSLSCAPMRDFLTGNRHRKRIAWVSSRLVWIVLVQPTIIGDEDKENDTLMEYFNKEDDINHFNIDVARTI
jgi:hypothetical protein